MGRLLPVMIIRDFSTLAKCYAEPIGLDRPGADMAVIGVKHGIL
jgi:hypothetical protein